MAAQHVEEVGRVDPVVLTIAQAGQVIGLVGVGGALDEPFDQVVARTTQGALAEQGRAKVEPVVGPVFV